MNAAVGRLLSAVSVLDEIDSLDLPEDSRSELANRVAESDSAAELEEIRQDALKLVSTQAA